MVRPTVTAILGALKRRGDAAAVEGMRRYGVVAQKAYGVSAPVIRQMAKETGRNHGLALKLWATGVYEARQIAALIADPQLTSEALMESWAADFDSWAICDGVCLNLFRHTPFAVKKARAWSRRHSSFVKRAGFVLMATLAVHDSEAPDTLFKSFLSLALREGNDERNEVKKAVNWAVRQIGKRNPSLNRNAMLIARKIRTLDSPAARWIAADALRELSGSAVQQRLRARKRKTAP